MRNKDKIIEIIQSQNEQILIDIYIKGLRVDE